MLKWNCFSSKSPPFQYLCLNKLISFVEWFNVCPLLQQPHEIMDTCSPEQKSKDACKYLGHILMHLEQPYKQASTSFSESLLLEPIAFPSSFGFGICSFSHANHPIPRLLYSPFSTKHYSRFSRDSFRIQCNVDFFVVVGIRGKKTMLAGK